MRDSIIEKLENFFRLYKKQEYREGDVLIRADEVPSGIFFLTDGIVKEYAISHKGEEVIVNIFKSGTFFPMSWAINRTKNKYFYEAITPVSLHIAPDDEVVTFIKDNPDIMYELLSRVYRGTDGILTRMVAFMSGDAYSRLITDLLIYVKRMGTIDKDKNNYTVAISEKDLGSMTGLARETISREMKHLKLKNLIEIRRNSMTILDIKKLEAELTENY